jgi:hypothetical protein
MAAGSDDFKQNHQTAGFDVEQNIAAATYWVDFKL